MNHLLLLFLLLFMPVPQHQNLPGAYYRLPEQVRKKATVIATGNYALGRSPYVLMRDGTQIWAEISSFQVTKVYQGQVGGKSIYINSDMLPKTEYVAATLEVGREYLVLLRPSSKSTELLKTGEHIPVRGALHDEEIIAIVPAHTTEEPTVSNPALRAELLDRVKQTDEMRIRLEKCAAEFHECDVPMDRLEKAFADDALRLKAIVKQYGWPGNELVGQEASSAATLILLNAELALKKEMLPLVDDAHRARKIDGSNYAFLVDDIRVGEGKPQVYGTRSRQGSAPYPIEDEANVDKRRAEVGLEPLAEQLEKQEKNKTPLNAAGDLSCLKETTLKVANRELVITLSDAERIKLTVEKYLAKTKPNLKSSISGPGTVFIDCLGTVRMGAWILESSSFSAEPELRLTVRIHNSKLVIVRREIRLQQTEGQWKVVGDGRVTYHQKHG